MRQDFQIIRHLVSKQTTLILEGMEKLIKLYPNVMSLRFNNAEPIDIIFQILEHYRYLLINWYQQPKYMDFITEMIYHVLEWVPYLEPLTLRVDANLATHLQKLIKYCKSVRSLQCSWTQEQSRFVLLHTYNYYRWFWKTSWILPEITLFWTYKENGGQPFLCLTPCIGLDNKSVHLLVDKKNSSGRFKDAT